MTVFGSEIYATTYIGLSIRSVHISLRTLGRFRFFNKQEAIAAIIGDSVVFFTTRRGVLVFYRSFVFYRK